VGSVSLISKGRINQHYSCIFFEYLKSGKGPGLKAQQIRSLLRGLKPPAPSGIFDLQL
jgi:hypothetical protein